MKTRLERVDRQVLPRVSGGVDWGRPRWVLARHKTKVLFWTPGHAVSGGVMGSFYSDGSLSLIDEAKGYSTVRHIAQGGRLSRARMMENADKIDAYFGCEVATQIDTRRTLVIT